MRELFKRIQAQVTALARSTVGRVVVAVVGLGGITLLLNNLGGREVLGVVRRAASLLPLLIAIDGVTIALELWALRLLYGKDREKVPLPAMLRASLIGYAVMCLVPMGRAVCEATKAATLARHTSGARAAAAATQFQGVSLLANAAITLPCAVGAYLAVGLTFLPLAILGTFVICSVIGAGVLLVGRFSKLGAWLGRRSKRAEGFGAAFDGHMQGEPTFPWAAIAWCFAARVIEVLRGVALVYYVGGPLSLVAGLTSQGIHFVGTAVGDIVPSSLGATEGVFTLMASALHVPPSAAIAIPLLTHLAQVFWVLVGVLVPLMWPVTSPALPAVAAADGKQ